MLIWANNKHCKFIVDIPEEPAVEAPTLMEEPEEPAPKKEPAAKPKKKPEKGAVMGDVIDLSLDDIPDDEPNLFNL